MSNIFSLSKLLAIAFFFSSLAPCDTLTITITGIANGSWNRDFFANAAFQFTFFVPDIDSVAAPACCAGVRSTPRGTSGTVTIANVGTGAMDPRGDQAVFVNPAAAAAGIWHYNSLDFLSVSNPALSSYDFTDTIAPVTGKTFFYNNQITMSDRVTTLLFTSVSDVAFSVQRRPGGGTPGVVSVSPDSLVAPLGVSTLFTFVVSDTAGAGDLQGLNILFSDPPFSDDVPFRYSDPYACWIWYERATKTVSLFVSEGWASAPLGAGGRLLRRGRCVVDTWRPP